LEKGLEPGSIPGLRILGIETGGFNFFKTQVLNELENPGFSRPGLRIYDVAQATIKRWTALKIRRFFQPDGAYKEIKIKIKKNKK
jgi:hypothetical protein